MGDSSYKTNTPGSPWSPISPLATFSCLVTENWFVFTTCKNKMTTTLDETVKRILGKLSQTNTFGQINECLLYDTQHKNLLKTMLQKEKDTKNMFLCTAPTFHKTLQCNSFSFSIRHLNISESTHLVSCWFDEAWNERGFSVNQIKSNFRLTSPSVFT